MKTIEPCSIARLYFFYELLLKPSGYFISISDKKSVDFIVAWVALCQK